jgi:methylenetetrahydrofolate reductase (NADPH)
VIYKERGHGLLQKVRLRKRPGTVGICATIKAKYNIDTVPHLICGGFSKEDTEDALIELNFLGSTTCWPCAAMPSRTNRTSSPSATATPMPWTSSARSPH